MNLRLVCRVAYRITSAFRASCKSRRDGLFIDYANPTNFFFLFFSGADPDLSPDRPALAPAAEKQKENNLWRFRTINRSSLRDLRTRRCGLACCIMGLLLCVGCGRLPGKPTAADVELMPRQVHDFGVLFRENCSGCHGNDGRGNGALALNNPTYMAIVSDDVLRRVTSKGVSGTLMPAFLKSAGGTLTDEQVEILVREIRARWSKPGDLANAATPPYAASMPGNSSHGAEVYATFCASCHGADGRGTQKGSSIVDSSYLALVSDQGLRTLVIAGRPDLPHPDWRGYVPGRAMTPQEVTDVVSWLVSKRVAYPGQPYASSKQ